MKPTLAVLAAGMGSRYGGLKQIDPVGPNGEIIIDYSLYDAIKADFGKIVFIIRHFFEDEFRQKIGDKYAKIVPVEYAYQELDCCLGDFQLPPEREKPWGTAHAVLVAKDVINEPFAVINADDYYGQNSIAAISKYLSSGEHSRSNDYAMVGFVLRNTLSEFGTVSRGLCQCDQDMYLRKVTELTKIAKKGTGAVFTEADGTEKDLTGDEIVSMNLWGFQPSIFDHAQKQFQDYLKEHGSENKLELYLPSVVDNLIQSDSAKVKVLQTNDSWFGVTYRQDKEFASASIKRLIDQDLYPNKL